MRNASALCVCAAFVAVGGSWLYWTYKVSSVAPGSVPAYGVFGDAFGVLNALFSGLAFAGLIVTILLQRRDIVEARIAQQESASALSAQLALLQQSHEGSRCRLSMDLVKEAASPQGYERAIAAYNCLRIANQSTDNLRMLVRTCTHEYPIVGFDEAFGRSADEEPGTSGSRNGDRDAHCLWAQLTLWMQWLYACDQGIADRELLKQYYSSIWPWWRDLVRPVVDAVREELQRPGSKQVPPYSWLELPGRFDAMFGMT